MSELENDVVCGTVLTGDETTADLEGVIVTTVLNTPGVTRLVRPWWRRVGTSDDRCAIRVSEEDGHTDVGIEVTVDLTVPIVRLTQDLRHRVATAITASGRIPGKIDVTVSKVERKDG